MAYEDAFLTNHQELLFDTGSEMIDLTMRVNAGGWSMALGDQNLPTIEPLTRQAVYRVEGPTDWGLQIAGMYYNNDIPKLRAVKSAKAAFALGKQFTENPRNKTRPNLAWFLCGHVMTEGFGVDPSSGIVSVPSLTLREREPLVFGTQWTETVGFSGAATQNSATTYSTTDMGTYTFSTDEPRPVLVYEIREFTQYLNQAATIDLVLYTGTRGTNSEITLQIRVPSANFRLDGTSGGNNRNAQGYVGMIDLADIKWSDSQLNAVGTAAASLTDWPTSGEYSLAVGVSRITNASLKMGVGLGRRQVAADS